MAEEGISMEGEEIKTDGRQNRYICGTKRGKREITLREKGEDP